MFLPQDCYIFVKLHVQRIKMLKLEINAHTVMKSIIKNSKVKLTSSDVRINNAASLAVSFFQSYTKFQNILFFWA